MNQNLPQLGATPIDLLSTRFTVWAPFHTQLHVCFTETGRVEVLTAGADGYHSLVTHAPEGARYQYRFADGRQRPDPASRSQPDGVHGPSMVVAQASGTLRPGFQNPTLSHHVLYELHVGTFTRQGTFDAIIPRLPELRDLGVTAIELMPVAQFPGERNWGYDGVGLFAAQSSYGGIVGLRHLIDACHAHGLAVILDVVYNHLGPEGNYLAAFGPYFTDRYTTPWGAALNFDGRGSDHVREFFVQNALYWTRDCGIDGLRLDAVHAIVDHSASTFVEELTNRVHDAASEQGRRVLVIAESSDNDPRLVRERRSGGIGLDGCWNDDYHHAIRAAITGDRRGYYAPFGEPSQIAKAIRDRYVFAGEYSSGHGRRHGAPAHDVDHAKLVVFTQNHDQVGNRAFGDRLDVTAGRDGARVAAALVMLSPFTPMLWMGEEYAETAPFQYFVSHSDEGLVEAVRRGRASEFAELLDAAAVPDPQAPATYDRSKVNWKQRDEGQHADTLAFYTHLLRLRRELDIAGRGTSVQAACSGTVVTLTYGGEPRLMLLANVGAAPMSVRLQDLGAAPGLTWATVLNTNDAKWGGAGAARCDATGSENRVTINAKTAMLLASARERS